MLDVKFKGNPGADLKRLSAYVPNAAQKANEAVGTLGERILKRRIGRIYVRTIPRSRTGRPLWKRSGALRRSPVRAVSTPQRLQIGFAGRPATPIKSYPGGYAQRRSELGVTWQPTNPAGGLTRRNDFLGETREILETQAPTVWSAVFERELDSK